MLLVLPALEQAPAGALVVSESLPEEFELALLSDEDREPTTLPSCRAFSRFYFVGDEDLLDIIGSGGDPLKLQRHLSKMFAGITAFDIDDEGNIPAPPPGLRDHRKSGARKRVILDTHRDCSETCGRQEKA